MSCDIAKGANTEFSACYVGVCGYITFYFFEILGVKFVLSMAAERPINSSYR